jgi:cytochrome c oxidase cbb3-type subunit 3
MLPVCARFAGKIKTRMAGIRNAKLLLFGAVTCICVMTGCAKPKAEPVLAEDVMDFNKLFAQNCAGCHGENGRGAAMHQLNDPVYLAIVPRKVLHDTIANGRPGTLMPAFSREKAGPLTPTQIDALVDGIERNWAKTPPVDKASLPPYAARHPGDPARGLAVFNKACALCHGEHGPAGSIRDPSFLSLISDQDLRTIVIIGRQNLGMPDWRSPLHMLGRPMTDQEITDVVAYLSSLRPALAEGAQSVQNQNDEKDQITKVDEKTGGGSAPTEKSKTIR